MTQTSARSGISSVFFSWFLLGPAILIAFLLITFNHLGWARIYAEGGAIAFISDLYRFALLIFPFWGAIHLVGLLVAINAWRKPLARSTGWVLPPLVLHALLAMYWLASVIGYIKGTWGFWL